MTERDQTGSADALCNIPVTSLSGVGPKLAEKLAQLHILTLQDLIFHLPLRYQDRTRLVPIAQARLGQDVMLQGEIIQSQVTFGRRRSLVCHIRDDSGIMTLRFFHFSNPQRHSLQAGATIRCFGEVRSGKSGVEMFHPEYQLVRNGDTATLEERLTPVYPTTDGLHQLRLRKLVSQALSLMDSKYSLTEWIPPNIRKQLQYPALTDAIRFLHYPPTQTQTSELKEGLHPCQQRLAFEELLSHRLCLRRIRWQNSQLAAPSLKPGNDLQQAFIQQLPFALTAAQARVNHEIANDMQQRLPMLRLLQGDVGSGKTVVAALAALQAAGSHYQAAIMAPTEILAEQHYRNFTAWLAPLGIEVSWLSGKIKGNQRKAALASIADGSATIAVGTHALFQDDVRFNRLGLIIIDEQHRFGVHQRLALREKGNNGQTLPHQLVMTATPIPRTLAMSAYADLECSIIDELPPGRTPVNTVVIDNNRRDDVIQRISQACQSGSQAYWVCTLIEESESLQCQAAEATWQSMQEQLPSLRIGLVHGRMKAAEKTAVMDAFKQGELDLLVATTVIEVGVDVPNASLMIIENPERLGLAQLHQLRGRVGRGAKASHCLLLYQAPLSQLGKQRLGIMRDSNDGFYIAEQDLQIRGPGQVLGTQQTGLMSFRIADLSRDEALLEPVKDVAERIETEFPSHVAPLIERWLGVRENYASV